MLSKHRLFFCKIVVCCHTGLENKNKPTCSSTLLQKPILAAAACCHCSNPTVTTFGVCCHVLGMSPCSRHVATFWSTSPYSGTSTPGTLSTPQAQCPTKQLVSWCTGWLLNFVFILLQNSSCSMHKNITVQGNKKREQRWWIHPCTGWFFSLAKQQSGKLGIGKTMVTRKNQQPDQPQIIVDIWNIKSIAKKGCQITMHPAYYWFN